MGEHGGIMGGVVDDEVGSMGVGEGAAPALIRRDLFEVEASEMVG